MGARRQTYRNFRDFFGDVIDPADHFVLPSGYRLSREDINRFAADPRFIGQPYDPYTNIPFPNADAPAILQQMVVYINQPARIYRAAGDRPAQQTRNIRQRTAGENTIPRPRPPASPPIPAFGVGIDAPILQGSAFSRMLKRSMQIDANSITQKLILLANRLPALNKNYRTLADQEIVKLAGLSAEEAGLLAKIELAPIERNNTGISSNGVPVKHVHGNAFMKRNPQQPVLIRGNSGSSKVTRI